VTQGTRPYGHFCMLARALEQLGDRWSLLVVRDLRLAPRRFTDLMDRLGGITPKTLSQRLKDLEASGIVAVDRQPGRREVWYRLTREGEDLKSALDELTLWGFRHNRRPRELGESLHPEHLLQALRVVLARTLTSGAPQVWQFRFLDDGSYTLAFDGSSWELAPTDTARADVVLTTTSAVWANYLTTPASERNGLPAGIDVRGGAAAIRAFERALTAFPDRARVANL
jgi:DNA-binding HxlR family transcriptional regulator